MRKFNTDLFAGLFGLTVFAIFWLAREADWRPSSALWPESILLVMAALSGLIVVRALIKRERYELFAEGSRLRMLLAGGSLVAWSVGMHFLGFVVTSLILFPVIVWFVTRAEQANSPEVAPTLSVRSWIVWAPVILAEIGLLYFIFRKVLLVPLPAGIAF